MPGKIVGIGLNYRDHAAERNKPLPAHPLVFLKPPSAVIGPGRRHRPAAWRRARGPRGRAGRGHRPPRARACAAADARAHVFGVTCVNDVTARDLQDRGVQFSHVKGYDTFAPIGPCIAAGLEDTDVEVAAPRQRQSSAAVHDPRS